MMSDQTIPEWKRIHKEATIVDMHAHPSLKVSIFNRVLRKRYKASRFFNPLSVRTDFPKLKDGGVDVLWSTVYAPERQIYQECKFLNIMRVIMPCRWRKIFGRPYFQVTNDMLDEMEKQVAKAKDKRTGKLFAKMAYSVKELDDILKMGNEAPIAVINNIEGAHSLDEKLENLDHFFKRGVAYITLAHFNDNGIANPCFPYPENIQILGCFKGDRDLTLGITKLGEQVVEKMMDLGMIIDVTHCTPPARKRVYEIVGKKMPIIASHVGAYEINPAAYNLKDWEIKKIADSGGVVGIVFMNYWLMPHETKRGLNFIARTLEHFIKVGGIDHVAIGTDYDGFNDPPDDIKDAAGLCKLTQRLIAEEYNEAKIKKIWGENALRVIREGWGKKI